MRKKDCVLDVLKPEQNIRNKTKPASEKKEAVLAVRTTMAKADSACDPCASVSKKKETGKCSAAAVKAMTATEGPIEEISPEGANEPTKNVFAKIKEKIHGRNTPEPSPQNEERDKNENPKKVSQRWTRRRKIRAAVSLVTVAVLLIGLFVGAYAIAEPWVEPFDIFAGTGSHAGNEIVLSVGETAAIQVPLGENEKIAAIETKDADILHIDGSEVTALGEFWTTVTVTTSEIEIPQRPIREVKIFGWDLSGTVDSIRTWLRDLFGVEEKQPERTELRTLNVYEIPVVVVGYEKLRGSDIKATMGSKGTDPTMTLDQEKTVLRSEDPKIVKTYMLQDGQYGYEALTKGTTELHSQIGFWKTVSEDTYAAYLEKYPQTAAYIEASQKACEQANIDYPYEGMIFVTQRQISYKVVTIQPLREYGGSGGSRLGGGGGGSGSGSSGGGSGGSSGSSGGSGGSTETAQTLLQMINAARAKEGLNPVSWSSGLASAAQIRVNEITEVMSHTRPNGEPFYTVSNLAYGENLAGGIAAAQKVFDAWMNSPGHRANILHPRYRTVGYAYLNYGAKYWHYWALLFGL